LGIWLQPTHLTDIQGDITSLEDVQALRARAVGQDDGKADTVQAGQLGVGRLSAKTSSPSVLCSPKV